MTATKVLGGVCGTLLVFLLGNWAAETLYHVGGTGHAAEGEEHVQGYMIEVDGGETEAAPEETVDFATLLASADAGSGERVWGKCRACHKLDGSNGTGPHLDGVVGRDIASVSDFGYSDALTGLEGDWTPEHLNEFLTNPKGYAPGTKMSFAGLPDAEDRANLIAYLETVGG